MLPAFPEALYRLKILNPDRRISLSSILLLSCIARLSLEGLIDPWLCLCLGLALLNYNAKRIMDFLRSKAMRTHKERLQLITKVHVLEDEKLREEFTEMQRELRALIAMSKL